MDSGSYLSIGIPEAKVTLLFLNTKVAKQAPLAHAGVTLPWEGLDSSFTAWIQLHPRHPRGP